MCEKEILPFEVSTLSKFYQEKAERELNDTPERRIQALKLIKDIAKKEKITQNIEFRDDFLLLFLRSRKFNVNKAFTQLKCLMELRRRYPLIFCGYRFETTVKSIENEIITFLPYRCPDGCAIAVINVDNWNPDEFPVEEVKRTVVVLLLQALRNPMNQVNGFKAIFDVESNPVRHLRHATPQNMYLIVHGILDCAPGRYKAVHIVNDSVTFKAAWMLLKPFIPKKIRTRFTFHAAPENLAHHFPPEILPAKYGGKLTNYGMEHWLRKVMQPEELKLMTGEK